MGIGLSIKEAIARFAERVPLQEAKLFAIVIAIQAQSGGNLSEVLSNLSDLLRERSKLQAKIKAMTSEARTSAWIIGGIPVLLIAAVSVFSPGFLAPLFETTRGNIILGLCVLWMGLGMVVMTSMMKVDL
jgi:tight adherence protein B